METLTTSQKWTYSEMLEKLPAESRYEIIDNELFDMSPAPNSKHQRISRRLEFILLKFIEEFNLGEVFNAPFDIILDQNNVVQPDLVFISTENAYKVSDRGLEGSPDMVVEISSPSSISKDQIKKKKLYEKFGIKEFWLIDPAKRMIEVMVLNENGIFDLNNYMIEKGKISSVIIKGFEVKAEEIFKLPY